MKNDEIATRCPVDTGRKLNAHKTFRRRPGRRLNVLCTFNLRPVSTGLFLKDFNATLHSKVNGFGSMGFKLEVTEIF